MNSKNSIILVDPDFDVDSADNCDLLIKVTADNFSYAIIDGSKNRLMVLYDHQECKNILDALSAVLNEDPYFSIPFRTIKASVFTPNTIAIPNEFFDSENLNIYAKFFGMVHSEQLHLQNLKGQEFTSIFNLDHAMEELLITKFGISKIFDHTAPLIALSNFITEKHLTLDFTAGTFYAVLTDCGKLIFQNCYETEDAEEFNYYLLLIIHRLAIDPQLTKISVSGIIHEDDKKFEVIKKYFSKIDFHTPNAEKLDNNILDNMPNQYYSSLLALRLCE
ncbi:MAG: DUF3822 family protein [Flavobacterium sp.]|nr:MAG: DUF3822 family protein [Flavobacterium sp.]